MHACYKGGSYVKENCHQNYTLTPVSMGKFPYLFMHVCALRLLLLRKRDSTKVYDQNNFV